MGHFLERYQPQTTDPIAVDALRDIHNSIKICERALNALDKMGQPLAEENGRAWGRRIKYVWNSDLRQDQERILDKNVNLMTAYLTLLVNLKSNVPQALLPFSQSLRQDAEQQQQEVEQRVNDMQIPNDADDTEDIGLPSSEDEEEMKVWTFPPHLEGQSGAALFVAVASGRSHEVKHLLDADCDPSLLDDHDRTLLHRACQNLDSKSFRQLLMVLDRLPEGCLDAADDRGDTALMLLAKQANTEVSLQMARDLLDAGGSASCVNRSETPRDALYYAMDAPKQEHRVAFVRMLADDFDADLTVVEEAFPQATKQYLNTVDRTQATEDDTEDEDEDDGTTQPLEKKQSLLNRLVRRLSTTDGETA